MILFLNQQTYQLSVLQWDDLVTQVDTAVNILALFKMWYVFIFFLLFDGT